MRKIPAHRVADALRVPANVLPGSPRLTLTAGELLCENHMGLRRYGGDCVEINTRDGFVRVRGDGLELTAMNRDELILRGFFAAVELF